MQRRRPSCDSELRQVHAEARCPPGRQDRGKVTLRESVHDTRRKCAIPTTLGIPIISETAPFQTSKPCAQCVLTLSLSVGLVACTPTLVSEVDGDR
jgi:hypothetical protein